jgi:hypothetical protein
MNLQQGQMGMSGEGLTDEPMEVAQHWVQSMEDHDLDGLVRLYAPGAILHFGDRSFQGQVEVRRYLEASGLTRAQLFMVEILGNGELEIHWQARLGVPGETRLRIERGQIAEQWVKVPEANALGAQVGVDELDLLDRW